jgi:hypothetical protein
VFGVGWFVTAGRSELPPVTTDTRGTTEYTPGSATDDKPFEGVPAGEFELATGEVPAGVVDAPGLDAGTEGAALLVGALGAGEEADPAVGVAGAVSEAGAGEVLEATAGLLLSARAEPAA